MKKMLLVILIGLCVNNLLHTLELDQIREVNKDLRRKLHRAKMSITDLEYKVLMDAEA